MQKERRAPRWSGWFRWTRSLRTRLQEERGAILVFVAVSLVGLIGAGGLAIDVGRGYLTKLRIGRAIDAAVIAGASSLRQGQAAATQQAFALAAINGFVDGVDGVSLSIVFGQNELGEQTVGMSGSTPMSTTLMRIMGYEEVQVSATSVAAVPPVDLALVIDQSASLWQTNAWDDVQDAATEFVGNFDDVIDQIGLSSFHALAVDRVPVGAPFQVAITNELANMNSSGYTNTGEGLRVAFEQMQNAPLRQRSTKAVVFFTDGRPTALRDNIYGVDRVIAVQGDLSINELAGYYNYSTLDENPPPPYPLVQPLDGCTSLRWWQTCDGWREGGVNGVRNQAAQNGIDMADQIRAAGYILYTIGLGNLGGGSQNAPPPDLDYLRLLANEGGIADPNQPKGRMFFAPTAAELSEVFDLVAKDLLVRLAQ